MLYERYASTLKYLRIVIVIVTDTIHLLKHNASQAQCFYLLDSKAHALPLSSRIKEEMMRSHSAFLVSSRTRTRSKRLSKGLARATFTERGSLESYWPFGLVAAKMVVLVFSLQTILQSRDCIGESRKTGL